VVRVEHVNLGVARQDEATLFYVLGLGCTRDPDFFVGPGNAWMNFGRHQFHLPTIGAQVLRGTIGISVPSLPRLVARLEAVGPRLAGTKFAFAADADGVDIRCPWGNRFRATQAPSDQAGDGRSIRYLRFDVPTGSASGIARFYRDLLAAEVRSDEAGHAEVVCAEGQQLVFQESSAGTDAYDGHHIAIYVADFDAVRQRLTDEGLVTSVEGAHQFRFVTIVEPGSAKVLYELEHEVRSCDHPAFTRTLANRPIDGSELGMVDVIAKGATFSLV